MMLEWAKNHTGDPAAAVVETQVEESPPLLYVQAEESPLVLYVQAEDCPPVVRLQAEDTSRTHTKTTLGVGGDCRSWKRGSNNHYGQSIYLSNILSQ
jgi:hypothetical protein